VVTENSMNVDVTLPVSGNTGRTYVSLVGLPASDYPQNCKDKIPEADYQCFDNYTEWFERHLYDYEAYSASGLDIDGYESESYDTFDRDIVGFEFLCRRCRALECVCCDKCQRFNTCDCFVNPKGIWHSEHVLDGVSDVVDSMSNADKLMFVGVKQFDTDSYSYTPVQKPISDSLYLNEKGEEDEQHERECVESSYMDYMITVSLPSVNGDGEDYFDIECSPESDISPNRKFIETGDGWKTRVPNRVLKAVRKDHTPYPTCARREYTEDKQTVDSLDRSSVFTIAGLEDFSRCSPVKATNDDLKFEQEFYCSAVRFLRVPVIVANDATRLRDLYHLLCRGKFDVTTLKEAFRNTNEVLYELCWFSSYEVVSKAVSNKYLYHFFRCGKQLTHLRSAKITENYRTGDAFMHWLNNYELMLRIFCDRKSNRFTQRLADYRKSLGKSTRYDYLNTCRSVEGSEEFIRKNSKYTKTVIKSKLIQESFDRQLDREEAPYEGQMFSSVREKTVEGLSRMTSDVLWNAIGDFMSKIPEKMTDTLSTVVSKGSEVVSSVSEFCVSVFNEFKAVVNKVLASVDTSSVLLGCSLLFSVFMFVFVLYYMRTMFQKMKQVYALCVVKVLNMVGCNLTKIESRNIEDIFVGADYEGQSLSAMAPIFGLAIGTALSITDKNSMQAANAAINFASRLPSVCTSFEDMCKDSLDYVYHWYTGKHWIKDKKVLDQFEQFIYDFDILMTMPRFDDMVISDLPTGKAFDELYKLAKILQPLLRDMKVNPSFVNQLNKAFALVLTKHQEIQDLSDYYMTRIETVCLWLYGNPGQGKTTVLEFIVAAVYEHCRAKFPVLFKAPYSRGVMHHRNKSSDYWEGYKRQFACVWNEALEKSESTERARMLSEFLTACEDGVFPLDMAFDQKGKAFFNSYLAVVTSNLTDAELDGKCGMSAPSAVVRRRTLYLQVVRDQDFVTPTCESCGLKDTCKHKLPPPNFNEAWKFILRYPSIQSFREAFELGTPATLIEALKSFGEEKGIVLRFNDVVRLLFEQICIRSAKRQDMSTTIRKTNFVDYCKYSEPYVSAEGISPPEVKLDRKREPPPVPPKLVRQEQAQRAKDRSIDQKKKVRVMRAQLDKLAEAPRPWVVSATQSVVDDIDVTKVEGQMFSFVAKQVGRLLPSVSDWEEILNEGNEFVPVPMVNGFHVKGFPLDYDNSVGTKMILENQDYYRKFVSELDEQYKSRTCSVSDIYVHKMMRRFYEFAFDVDPRRRKRIIRLAKYLFVLENHQFHLDDSQARDFMSCRTEYGKMMDSFCFKKLKKIGISSDLAIGFIVESRNNSLYDYDQFLRKGYEAFGFMLCIVFCRSGVRQLDWEDKSVNWRTTLQKFDIERMRVENVTPEFHPQQVTTRLSKEEEVKDNSVHWSLKAKVLKRKWDAWRDETYSPFMREHSWLVFGAIASVLTATVSSISIYYGVSYFQDKSKLPNTHDPYKCGTQEEIHSKLPLRPELQSATRGHSQRMGPRDVAGHSVSRGHQTRMHPRDVSGHSVSRGHDSRIRPRVVHGHSHFVHTPDAPWNYGTPEDGPQWDDIMERSVARSVDWDSSQEYSIREAKRYFWDDREFIKIPGAFLGVTTHDGRAVVSVNENITPVEVDAVMWFWGDLPVITGPFPGSYVVITWDHVQRDGGSGIASVVHYADILWPYVGDEGIDSNVLAAYEKFDENSASLLSEILMKKGYVGHSSSSDQQTTNLAQHIRTIRVTYASKGSFEAEGILSGRRFICVGHFFDENGLDFHSISLRNGQTDMMVAFANHVVVKPLDGRRDLVSIDFPQNLSAFKSIVPKLYSNLDEMQRLMPLDGDFCRLERTITPDDCVLITKTRRAHIKRGTRPIVEIKLGGITKPHNHELYYAMAGGLGVPGNCGLPYAITNSTGVVMCIGVHTGRTGDTSVFSPIFKSDFPSDVMSVEGQCAYIPEYMRINTPELSQPVENHKFLYLGQAPKVKIIPKKTRLRASPAQGDFTVEPLYPLTTAPAVLDWEYRERKSSTGEGMERWIVYPLKNALKKLGASPARPVYTWMNSLVYERKDIAFEGFFPEDMDFENIRPWTIEEVLFGIPGVWDGLARDTAIGYDIECVIPAVKSRKELWDPETRFIHPLLRILVEKLDAAVKRGELPKNVVAACLKDETRDLERVELGKTRLFCVGSLSHLIWSVMWMGGLVSEMKRCRLSSDVAIGTNVHAFDWKMIYAKIIQMDKDFDLACGDFGNFDSSQYAMFGVWLGEACAPMYRFPKGSFEDRCIRAVCMSAVAPLLVVIDKVYWMDYDNASGNWLTGFLNSFVNVLMFNFILHQIQYEHRDDDPEFYRASRRAILILMVYGDDNVWGMFKKYSKYFNMKIFAKWVYELFGMTYTKATKGDIDSDFTLKEDMSFLCRKFKVEGGNVKAPLDEDSIYSMLMWIREPSKTAVPQVTLEDQFQINLETACQEWYHYGRERFEIETTKMRNFCRQIGINYPGQDYSVYSNRWLDHQQ
jgi:hypothetical protein